MERFDFIASDDLRACLMRDAGELVACMEARAWKAALVLAGSLIHAILIDYLTSSGKAAEDELLRLTFSELLDLCRKEQVLSSRTVDLTSFIRPYADLLNPSSRARLQVTSDETGARFAQALLEIVIQEVSVHKRDTPRFTAEQVMAKLQADPSSVVIIGHLLRKLSRFELERLLASLLPKVYFEMSRLAEPGASQTLKHFEQCFRMGFDLAPPELKRDIAARFVYILENESEYVVGGYESCFFRGSDLEFLVEEERAIVKAHFFSSLAKQVTLPLVNAAGGMGAFLASEQDTRAFFVPLVLAFLEVKDEALASAIRTRIAEEYAALQEEYRRGIGAWADRLRSFLEADSRRSGSLAIQRLKSALIGLPESA